MNFAPYQWVLSMVLDLMIKSVIVTVLGVLVTLGAAPVFAFVSAALKLSIFHFSCVLFACLVVWLVELGPVRFHRAVKFFLTIAMANALFVVSFAALLSHKVNPNEVIPSFSQNLMPGSFLAITNIIPLLIAKVCGRISRRR